MTCDGQVFVVNVVIINLAHEMMVTNVINRPTSVIVKLNVIAKIRKYRKFYEGHHFILMAMEMHCALKCDIDHFIRECVRLFHNR